jgi:hypothetical protein
VSNGATVAADQIHSRGVHSDDACGVSYTEDISGSGGALKIPMCNAGHYGINTGKLTYGKTSHSASVDLTAYDANPSTSECKVGAGETAYAWLTVIATHVHDRPLSGRVATLLRLSVASAPAGAKPGDPPPPQAASAAETAQAANRAM